MGKEQEGIRAETPFPSVLGLRCCLKTKWVISRYFKEEKQFCWSPHKVTGWRSGPFQNWSSNGRRCRGRGVQFIENTRGEVEQEPP